MVFTVEKKEEIRQNFTSFLYFLNNKGRVFFYCVS
jgi:hypothetical protein